tara:strand:- start:84 stop:239 length:156 start_codon:yes stop_codon:yes gene_type:complete
MMKRPENKFFKMLKEDLKSKDLRMIPVKNTLTIQNIEVSLKAMRETLRIGL